jgi:hypothetical protein
MHDDTPKPSCRTDARTLRRLAVVADLDPRTIRRYLEGRPMMSGTRERAQAALDRLAASTHEVQP